MLPEVIMDVAGNSSYQLPAISGEIFIAGASGNNYGGCLYIILMAYTGISYVKTIYEFNCGMTFSTKGVLNLIGTCNNLRSSSNEGIVFFIKKIR